MTTEMSITGHFARNKLLTISYILDWLDQCHPVQANVVPIVRCGRCCQWRNSRGICQSTCNANEMLPFYMGMPSAGQSTLTRPSFVALKIVCITRLPQEETGCAYTN